MVPSLRRILISTIFGILISLCFASSPLFGKEPVSYLSPDKLEKGMTGYGKTVFEGTDIDTFSVEVKGILKNVMPDFDMVLIKAKKPILKETQIMQGMSGSPVYINGKLIGALAYSWPFAKEALAGVTPIRNMLESNSNSSSLTVDGQSFKKISTPIITSGLSGKVRNQISKQFTELGIRNNLIAGGSSGSFSNMDTAAARNLQPGSAMGIQLMHGDLGMTALGTVTHRSDNQILGFGHQFMNSGEINFPLTTAKIHTPMPSLRTSFKFGSPKKTVGSIVEDRRAAIVGSLGNRSEMLPVTIKLHSPSRNFSKQYSLNVIRNKYLTPGLISSAVSNFAVTKMQEQGINRLQSKINVSLKNQQDLSFQQTNHVSGSFDAWAFLPLKPIWANPFTTPEVENVKLDLTLKEGRESAKINDLWLDKKQVKPGGKINVFFQIDPYRSNSTTKRIQIRLPDKINSGRVRISVVPASKLIQLQPPPETLDQLISRFNNWKSGSKMALLVESSQPGLEASGHRMSYIPNSFASLYDKAGKENLRRTPSFHHKILSSDWIISNGKSMTVSVESP